jgi:peroxiredoxin
MNMRTLLALALGAISLSAGEYKVPRSSPEFVINYPGNKQDLLSRYKGKVVVLSFIFTTCPHCQRECQLLSKLYTELGPKGFQPLAVAVNPMAVMLVPDFIRDFHVNFPVGASDPAPALSFLHIEPTERWVVPQVALIDRKGNIRAQTPFNGDEKLQEENNLRQLIEGLLKEGSAATRTKVTKKAS